MTTKEEISPDVSRRICSHMNADHAPTVHAMVLSTLSGRDGRLKVNNAKLKSVSLTEYTLSYVVCDGDACEMKKAVVPFLPPLSSVDDARPRLIQEHHKALTPRFSWLMSDPLMRTLFTASLLVGIATHIIGRDELVTLVDETPWASSAVGTMFGSSALFSKLVVYAWYLCLVTHGAEAVYVGYECKNRLKMTNAIALKWFLMVLCTGFPVMNKIKELVEVDKNARSRKGE